MPRRQGGETRRVGRGRVATPHHVEVGPHQDEIAALNVPHQDEDVGVTLLSRAPHRWSVRGGSVALIASGRTSSLLIGKASGHLSRSISICCLTPAPELLRLAEHILDGKLQAFDPSGFRDRYEEALMARALGASGLIRSARDS
jgi:hypothetical protein